MAVRRLERQRRDPSRGTIRHTYSSVHRKVETIARRGGGRFER